MAAEASRDNLAGNRINAKTQDATGNSDLPKWRPRDGKTLQLERLLDDLRDRLGTAGINFCVAIDNLLQELGIKQGRLTPYYLDSLSSVHVGKRDKAVKLSAWLQRRTLVLHEASDTEVLIIHIPGADMLADPFTKYLKYETWRRHMKVLLNRPEAF